VHLLTRIGQNSKQIIGIQKTEDRIRKSKVRGPIPDLYHRLLGVVGHVVFGHLVFKTFGENFYKCLGDKSIDVKPKKSKNKRKCAEIDRDARVLSRN